MTKAKGSARCGRSSKISLVKCNGIREMSAPRGVPRMSELAEKKQHNKGDSTEDEESGRKERT
jgi:hypothetical protein